MGNRNHGSLLKKATAAGLACVLFAAGLPLTAAAEESCKDWRTAKFFESATVKQVRACLSAGRDPNEQDPKGLTALHRAARDLRPGRDRGVAGCGRQPEGVQQSRQAAPVLRAEEQKDPRLRRLSTAHDRVGEETEEGGLVPSASRAAPSKDQDTVVPGRSPAGKRGVQGPLPIGHGRFHHARARERASAHFPKAGCAQGAHPARSGNDGRGGLPWRFAVRRLRSRLCCLRNQLRRYR